MNCKHCGVAIHKCSSADEYHADDKMEYIKELDGSGCIHEPESGLTPLAPDAAKAEPYFDPELPEEYIEGVIYYQNRRAGKA